MVICLDHPDRFDESLIVQMSLEKDEINPRKQISSPQPEVSSNHTPPTALVPRLDDINAYHTVKHPSTVKAMPKQPANHGAPVREYMNKKVSGVLLEGMKLLSIEK